MYKETMTPSRRDFLKAGAAVGLAAASTGVLGACSSEEDDVEEAVDAEEAVESSTDTIYIVDTLCCQPGDGEALYDHYVENYVPGALERGMTYVGAQVNPPIWLTDEDSSNTLTFIWSVAGMMGWAAMVGVSRYDSVVAPQLIEFWRDIDERVASRTRRFFADVSEVESLTTLARLGA